MNGYWFFMLPQNIDAFMVKAVPSKPSLCCPLFALWGVLFSILTEEHEQTTTPLAPIKQIMPILEIALLVLTLSKILLTDF